MRIAIDARMVKHGSMHGIARYVVHLLQCLSSMNNDHDFFVFVNQNNPLQDETWPSHVHLIRLKGEWISFKEQWEVPRILKKLHIDLFHATSFVAPLLCPCRLIMTIHDLNHLVLPQFYTPFHQFYYQIFVRRCIQRSEYILTVSNFSKNEIVKTLNVPAEKVFVTYNGVAQQYRPINDQRYLDYVRDMYELPSKFILCVSNIKPHKNILQLVRAYCFSNLTVPLVLACPVDNKLIKLAEQYNKKHLIYFTKFISEEHLPAVYSMAHLFAFPSTYEGFGLPPLEALSCGTPVVVARSSSLPEVVGKNAIFANPFDHIDIAKALEIGVHDENLRASLSRNGIAHARTFSWQEMTRKTLEIYHRCLFPSHGMELLEKTLNG